MKITQPNIDAIQSVCHKIKLKKIQFVVARRGKVWELRAPKADLKIPLDRKIVSFSNSMLWIAKREEGKWKLWKFPCLTVWWELIAECGLSMKKDRNPFGFCHFGFIGKMSFRDFPSSSGWRHVDDNVLFSTTRKDGEEAEKMRKLSPFSALP